MRKCLLLAVFVAGASTAGGKADAGVPRVDPTGKACSWSKPEKAIRCEDGEVPVCVVDKYDDKSPPFGGWSCAKPTKP